MFIITNKTENHIEDQAAEIVNRYVDFWSSNDAHFHEYKIEELDNKYYYLINAYENKIVDIFNYDNSIYYNMFMVK